MPSKLFLKQQYGMRCFSIYLDSILLTPPSLFVSLQKKEDTSIKIIC